MGKISNVYICVVPYHLYLSLLLINDKKDNAYILLNANNETVYKQFIDIAPKLKKAGYSLDTRLRNKTKDIVGLESGISKKQFEKVFQGDKNPVFDLYNFAWNLQYVYSTADLFYKKCRKAYFVEEGALTPINPPQPGWKVLIKKLTGAPVDFYKDKKVEGIYVQKPDIYPASWKSKLKTLDVKKLLTELKDDIKETILDIFVGNIREYLKGADSDVGIIYTQPLSEDGYITEDTKKDYFRQMAEYYGEGRLVFFKIHPRDLSNYVLPSNCTILPGYFPSELLNLLNIRFKFAVGVCTSAVPTTDAEIKLNINENFLHDQKFDLIPINQVQEGERK